MHKIGINLEAKAGLGAADYIACAHEVGFDALLTETPTEAELSVIANALAKYGMHYEMIHSPFHRINAMWLPGEEGDGALADMTRAVDRAHAAGNIPVVVLHLSSGRTPPPVTDLGAARFDKLVEYAAQKGVRLAFENQRMPWNLAWAMERYAAAPHVGFCWDCGHEGCFTPGVEFMPLYGDRILCTHLHDNDRVFNDDQHRIPFDGKINFSRVAAQLREHHFAGALTLELFAEKSRQYDFLSCAAFLEQAAVAAKRVRRMVDGFDW